MRSTGRVLVACLVAVVVAPLAAGDEGWVIDRFESRIDIQPDGSFTALEALDVDFGRQTHHGIFRDLVYRQDYDRTRTRDYQISLGGVTDAQGRRLEVKTSTEGAIRRFRIGDPDRTVSGKQTYRIDYRVRRALNAFSDHDELYWNVTGTWPARMLAAVIAVHAPAASLERVACFQGSSGSTEVCKATFTPDEARFEATRFLAAGEQMTIVAALRKGAVAAPVPLLATKPRPPAEFFDLSPGLLVAMGALFAVVLGGLGRLWWRIGRDRRFVAMHYLAPGDTSEQRVPLFSADPIVVEFEPPDKIRPAQMGLLLDERADTLDATATIIDLAARGYLTIKELPKQGWFGGRDWELDQVKPPDASLLEYEQIILKGLFDDGPSRRLSGLKNVYYRTLAKAKTALYDNAVTRGWFPRNPNSVRALTTGLGIAAAAAGIGLTILLGRTWGAGLLGLPVVAGGLLLLIGSGAMPRRTALGREALRRTLGFARYIRTAEQHQQAFAERANIFTSYLPYAIVFKSVDQWARAFKDIDLQQATAGWYVSSRPFNAGTLSSTLSGFSTSMSSAIASTPGGSGGSGFSGGSSGGGGGGGGGGSW